MQSAKTFEFEEKILGVLEEAVYPVTTRYVAKKMSLSWTTASRLLTKMTIDGKIQLVNTCSGMMFALKPNCLPANN